MLQVQDKVPGGPTPHRGPPRTNDMRIRPAHLRLHDFAWKCWYRAIRQESLSCTVKLRCDWHIDSKHLIVLPPMENCLTEPRSPHSEQSRQHHSYSNPSLSQGTAFRYYTSIPSDNAPSYNPSTFPFRQLATNPSIAVISTGYAGTTRIVHSVDLNCCVDRASVILPTKSVCNP
jgi:hypothetical protein